MNSESPSPRRSLHRRNQRWLVLCVVILAIGYVLVRPVLEQRFGITLPALDGTSTTSEDRATGTVEGPPPTAESLPGAVPSADTAKELRLGQLQETDQGLRSSAGLLYPYRGQRLDHVLRHDDDQPDRRGFHGVFDGDEDTLLAVLDEAYLLVKQGSSRVRTRRDGERTIHDVDMGRRIGFVGGQEGKRRGHPPASRIRLVLEGDVVITAYPLET